MMEEVNLSNHPMPSDEKLVNLIKDLVEQIKALSDSDVEINNGDTIILTVTVMELVEQASKTTTLTGEEKATVAQSVIIQSLDFIPDSKLSKNDKEDIIFLLPNTIETLVKASKGEFNFKPSSKNKVKIDTVKVANKLYDRMKEFITAKKYEASYVSTNVALLSAKVMSLVEEYPYLTGREKKTIVMTIMCKIAEDAEEIFPKASKKEIRLIRTSLVILPALIDSLILATRGRININLGDVGTKFCNCLKGLLCCGGPKK